MSAEHTAHSRKPSNIIVEFDIGTSFENLAQAGLLSNDPLATFASISALCALVSRRTQIELDPGQASFIGLLTTIGMMDGRFIKEN